MKPTPTATASLTQFPTPAATNFGISITASGEAFGHHGNCVSFNQCGDAATCALQACISQGYATLVSYGASGPCTGFSVCNLLENIFDDVCILDYNWGNDCAVMVVTDIQCADPGGACAV
jgi:hypothetical protein